MDDICKYSALVILFITTVIYGKTIYVAADGNDINPGTIDSPWQSIQKGLDQTFAGDTLMIRGGAYYIKDNLFVKNSGTKNNWATIMAYPGEDVAINADAVAKHLKDARKGWRWHGSLHISGVHYVRVQGLTILYSHGGGIMVRGKKGRYGEKPTSNIEISQCKVHSSYNSGIGVWYTDSVKVMHCEIVDANNQRHRPIDFPIRREAPHEALSVPGCSNFEIAYNYLHLNQKEGIDIKEFSSNGKVHHNYVHNVLREGIYIDSWFGTLENIEVYNNIVHDCDWGFLISSEGKNSNMKNIYVHDNLFYNNYGKGIGISVLGNNELRQNIYIYNNTICYNGTPAHWSGKTGGIGIVSDQVEDLFIYNNILYKNYGYQIASFADESILKGKKQLNKRNIVIENNLMDAVYQDTSTTPGFFGIELFICNGDNYMLADPKFVAPQIFNFNLQANSPAVKGSISKGYDEYQNLGANISLFGHLPKILPQKFLMKPVIKN